jgi:hypothetical protein
MLPQEESLDIFTEFLLHHDYREVKSIPIDAIRKLARLVITENVFTYEKKFYRQIVGATMGSAFTLTLANIFMWKWEKELVRRPLTSNELYDEFSSLFYQNISYLKKIYIYLNSILNRYMDDIFFTSNESLETINQMLNQANNLHPNIN